jgi:hypothetical protein
MMFNHKRRENPFNTQSFLFKEAKYIPPAHQQGVWHLSRDKDFRAFQFRKKETLGRRRIECIPTGSPLTWKAARTIAKCVRYISWFLDDCSWVCRVSCRFTQSWVIPLANLTTTSQNEPHIRQRCTNDLQQARDHFALSFLVIRV